MARVFTPNPSSLHYKIASLGDSFSICKPQTLCGYVAAVLEPVFLGVVLAISFAFAGVYMFGGAMILLGFYDQVDRIMSVVALLLGGGLGFFALVTGSLFSEDTRVGKWCTAGVEWLASLIGSATSHVRALCATTTIAYDSPPDR